jgi:hypothetical protein
MALATFVAISGPKKSRFSQSYTMALVMDIDRLKIITSRAIKTTGTLIVLSAEYGLAASALELYG